MRWGFLLLLSSRTSFSSSVLPSDTSEGRCLQRRYAARSSAHGVMWHEWAQAWSNVAGGGGGGGRRRGKARRLSRRACGKHPHSSFFLRQIIHPRNPHSLHPPSEQHPARSHQTHPARSGGLDRRVRDPFAPTHDPFVECGTPTHEAGTWAVAAETRSWQPL